MITLLVRVLSFLPVMSAWITSGSSAWLGSVISAPSDCNWKMTSFSDFPIRFAMSLTRIFAAAIQSPFGSGDRGQGTGHRFSCPLSPVACPLFCRRRLFLGRRLFFSFFSFFFVRVLFLALALLFRDLFDLFVLLGEL